MAPITAEHRWFNTGEVQLHYLDWAGGGPPVLCIHGLTTNCRGWDALAETLGTRHRLIAVDLRGRGESDKPPSGPYGLAAHARDLAALVRSLGVGPVAVVGWSMGANIGMVLAAEFPDLVSHLVLVDGGAGLDAGMTATLRAEDKGATIPRLSRTFPSFFPSFQSYVQDWQQSGMIRPWTEYFERFLAADVEERPDGTALARTSRAAVEEGIMDIQTFDPALVAPRVQVPVLVLWAPVGLEDPARPLFARSVLERLVNLLPDARLATIDGANHLTIVFVPEYVRQMVSMLETFVGA